MKKEILRRNDTDAYLKDKYAQEELRLAKDAEYDAAADLRISQVFLEIDEKNKDFSINRYQILG